MPFEKLSADEISGRRTNVDSQYVDFIRSLAVGEGGKTSTDKEGVTKTTLKKKLAKAAALAKVSIRFMTTPADIVIFEVVKKHDVARPQMANKPPKRPKRPTKPRPRPDPAGDRD